MTKIDSSFRESDNRVNQNMQCSHCLAEILPSEKVYETETPDGPLIFCCTGCQGIYALINEQGLSSFYTRRQGWRSGPAAESIIDAELFSDDITSNTDKSLSIRLQISGLRCASCVWLVEKGVGKLGGVLSCRLNYATNQAVIKWHQEQISLQKILDRIQQFGYIPCPAGSELAELQQSRDLLIRFGTCAFLAMQLMIYSMALYAGYFQGMNSTMRTLLQGMAGLVATPVVFFGGWPFIQGAVAGLKSRYFTMDLLIVLGVGAAYLLSIYQTIYGGEVYYDTAVMIITLVLLGRLLESGARKKAAAAIKGMAALAPQLARLYDEGKSDKTHTMVPVKKIEHGQLLQVLPGESIPLDGIVKSGTSEVDQSMLTGEPEPVNKNKGVQVMAGTICLNGSLVFEVTHGDGETVLSRIIQSVEEAQSRKAPVQAVADKIVSWFVPIVLVVAVGAFFVAVREQSLQDAIIRMVSVLIVACPCALGLATPLAILVGSGIGSEKGILFKGGDVLEQAAHVGQVVFDKTGTLTQGKMTLEQILLHAESLATEQCLQVAASLETNSEHSIGRAIAQKGASLELFSVDQFKVHPGLGVEGVIQGVMYRIGNSRFVKQGKWVDSELAQYNDRQRTSNASKVYLADEHRVLAEFIIKDQLRQEAPDAVTELNEMGVDVCLVSGDQEEPVADAANLANIKSFVHGALPHEKVAFVEKIKSSGKISAMVGDGINDAPALAVADIGIAVAKGTDLAMESSDLVLMREDLGLVPEAFRLARKTMTTIRVNLFWAFSYNLVVLPTAFFGFLHPIFSAAAMTLSSLCVVGNSLWLRKKVAGGAR